MTAKFGARTLARFDRGIDAIFAGTTRAWVYAALRIGLSSLLLARETDWLRPIVKLEHHRFVHGFDLAWSGPKPPYLVSPLAFGVALGETSTTALVYARTCFAVLLLLGIRSRLSAALLAVASYALLAADRYHYYHHLYVLFVGIAWLSLCPLDARWSVERFVRRRLTGAGVVHDESPLWPLQLVRAFTLSVYLASGVAKLNTDWLRGTVLGELHAVGAVQGASWDAASSAFGARGVAILTCATELLLPALLACATTRRVAVVAAWVFHLSIGSSMNVFTFGAQMAVLLVAFLPDTAEKRGALAPRSD